MRKFIGSYFNKKCIILVPYFLSLACLIWLYRLSLPLKEKKKRFQAYFLALHSLLMYSACHHVSHMLQVCAVSAKQARVCVSTGELDPMQNRDPMQPCTSTRTMGYSLVRKRVCNTICSLNGTRQRVRRSPHITTATILQQQQCVCVCVSSLSFQLLQVSVRIMNYFPKQCDLTLPCFQ